MKNLFLMCVMLFIACFSNAQKVDTIINTGIYKSYFSKELKEPLYVAYKLYKGGGECVRTKFHFKNDTKLVMATAKDYSGDGGERAIYDEGHLANAEDFANNCVNDEKTFRFYNCLPQTGNLNRGIWKHWETEIRKESQDDSLLIICGGEFKEHRLLGLNKEQKSDNVIVPDHCWKVVISLKTNKITHILYFTNEVKENTVQNLNKVEDLENLIGYKFNIKY